MTDAKANRPKECSAAGFTLLELLVALAIFATVILVALPRLGGTTSRVSLRSTTLQLVAELRATRSAALWSNVEKTLSIDLDGYSYWSDAYVKRRTIPAGIGLELFGAGIETTGTGQKRRRFRPDGSAGAGSFRLRYGQQSAVVTVDELTSSTQIEWIK